MNTLNCLQKDNTHSQVCSPEKSYKFSFSSFQKAIVANSELRKQVEDLVDLGLLENEFRHNTDFIQSVRKKAEAETVELMMQFVNGNYNFQLVGKIAHRNRIIKALANKDKQDHRELLNRLTHSKAEVR
jgi:hypothetical protein